MEVTITIDASLVNYFEQGIRKDHLEAASDELLVEFLTSLLGDTSYPISAQRTGPQEIRLGYRPKSFADPIF